VPADWNFNNELKEVWHFSLGRFVALWQPKHWFFRSKK